MKIKSYHDGTMDLRTALWVSFWLFIATINEPDLIDAVTAYVWQAGRALG